MARIREVPEEYNTIRDAVEHSSDGDTILIAPGVYREQNIRLEDIDLYITSWITLDNDPAYMDSTILDGEGDASMLFSLDETVTERTTIRGLTLQNARQGIHNHGTPIIEDCAFIDNSAEDNHCSAVVSDVGQSGLTISRCYFEGNGWDDGVYGGAVYAACQEDVIIEDCIFYRNIGDIYGAVYLSRTGNEKIIRNCKFIENASNFGGAIRCSGGSGDDPFVSISDCLFDGNQANVGCAIYANTHTKLSNCTFTNQISASDHEALSVIYANSAEVILDHVLIVDNLVPAIKVRRNSVTIQNSTITNNIADEGDGYGGVMFDRDAELIVVNSIIWNNNGPSFSTYGEDIEGSLINISYSCVEGGEDGIGEAFSELELGNGIIDEDPLFVDSENGDFSLAFGSPCIDSGDPDFPADEDGTRIDIGALGVTQLAWLEGTVIDFATREPLPDIKISTNYHRETVTDSSGYFGIWHTARPNLVVTASALGYNPVSSDDIHFPPDTSVVVHFALKYPLFYIAGNNITVTIDSGESVDYRIEIENPGNGILEWSATKDWRLETEFPDWSIIENVDVSAELNDERLRGASFFGNRFFITGLGYNGEIDSENSIYIMNRDFELVDVFDQPEPDDRHGLSGLTAANDTIWGGIGLNVYGMDSDGEVLSQWSDNNNHLNFEIKDIAWDPDLELLWICSLDESFHAFTTSGVRRQSIDMLSRSIAKIAYFPDDVDGYNLYALDQPDGETVYLRKYNIQTNDTITVAAYTFDEDERLQSIDFSFDLSPYYPVMIGLTTHTDGDGDSLNFWKMPHTTDWISLDPQSGTIEPEDWMEITVHMTDLIPSLTTYPGKLTFWHNAFEESLVFNISLRIDDHSSGLMENLLPTEFGIRSIYPNPFNSTAIIEYSLPTASEMSLTIYDIEGRRVKVLTKGHSEIGHHRAIWREANVSAGVYFCRLEAGGKTINRKLVL
ncbi:right-handed parallel beta-helix repeat-containing protein, partial [Calditrichota bacterium]